MTEDYLSSCAGKTFFDTRAQALENLDRLRDRRRIEPAVAYKCRHCTGFHIGSRKFVRRQPYKREPMIQWRALEFT